MPQSKLDLEVCRYLPLLNIRQKRMVLALVKAYDVKQRVFWEELYNEQQRATKRPRSEKKGTSSR